MGDRRPPARSARRPPRCSARMGRHAGRRGRLRRRSVAVVAPGRLLLALPILVLWCISPALAYATGRPLRRTGPPLRAASAGPPALARANLAVLRRPVGPGGPLADPRQHPGEPARPGRPPDLADQHRAAAALGARRLRFRLPDARASLDRLEPTFDTLLRMQRYRGHFYNWYDTRRSAAAPAYISTVDSGNLAGYL